MMKNALGLTRPATLITARDEIDRLVVEGAGYIAARVELGQQG
ncbi:hypothetical protein ACWWJF_13625 [Symbiopectobacterium sp. Eva_TO]